ncbi:sorting nexin-29-like isoform X1 [Centruroides sculpturatus]|uniref:sorting nexin-29-like isoform X1 n=2 Tax=Centruroides sculpturatus TaxID=218467 RepID=UPI000C6DB394|nr:sorting nexin-29-like isoform X1 [Centruroides sculpturatus]
MNVNSESSKSYEEERQTLLLHLLDAVKQCQIRFGGRTELATESDSRIVSLCTQFEAVLQHGFRGNNKNYSAFRQVTEIMKGLNLKNLESEPAFWHFVRTILNKHEYERYLMLKNTSTDVGRGRAWLRSALNERSLERYMHMMLADATHISQFYEDWAFLMDQERSSMLPMMSAGLGSILFAINIDNPDLDIFDYNRVENKITINNTEEVLDEPLPIIAKSLGVHSGGKKRKRKKPSLQVISFDDNDLRENEYENVSLPPSYSSAPPTCLSSPVVYNGNFGALTDSVMTDDTNQRFSKDSDKNISKKSEEVISVLASSENKSEDSDKLINGNIDSDQDIPSFRVQDLSTKDDVSNVENGLPSKTILTPIDNASIGELIPLNQGDDIQSSEDSVSIPSYGEETENAAAALAVAQRGTNWGTVGPSSQTSLNSAVILANRKPSEPRSRSETLSMSNDELREALLVVLHRKDELEETNNSLRNLLDKEMEMCAGLRAEMEEMKKQHEEKNERQEIKLQTLSRENDLLKHQLKKYIAAVQMLKRDSVKAQETLSGMIGDVQPAIPEPRIYIDHQYEAAEYEKKLVQVAEMHGELMEFNERLHRLLLQREASIRRLKEELVDLRGPLPDDNQTSDDDISITSDYDASSQTAASRPLINIWIPSAFLAGRTTDLHHVYQVYIRIRDDEWNIYRRYAEFYALHKSLKKKHPIVNTFDFPPKKTLGNKDAKVVEERRRRFQHYLRSIINWMLQTNSDLTNNPDRETIISLLPFFGEKENDTKSQSPRTVSNRLRFAARNSPPTGAERPVQHYMGL